MKRVMLVAVLAVVLMLSLSAAALAAPTITNGDFELGNTGFTSDYTYAGTAGPSALWAAGTYTVGYSPKQYHALWSDFGPHGGSNMLIANGSADNSMVVWEGTVSGLVPGRVFSFNAWVASSYPASPATLTLTFATGASQVIGVETTPTTPGEWKQISGTALVPAGVYAARLAITNSNEVLGGNDFCIDDITVVDEGSTYGKTTGGIKFMAGSVEVQLNFVAMADEKGAKGNVKYAASNGNQFHGKVTGYFQSGNTAVFVGEIAKTNNSGWNYFYVAVRDNGEGAACDPDEGVRVLVQSTPYPSPVSLDDATGSYDAFTGNVQIH